MTERLDHRRGAAEIVRILVRRRRRMAVFFAAAVCLALVGVACCPRAYRSEAKLLVRVGRESVGLDPTTTTTQHIGVHESRETEIRSAMEVLSSRAVAERVVEQLGVDVVLGKQSGEATAGESGGFGIGRAIDGARRAAAQIGLADLAPEKEKAVSELASATTVWIPDRSNLVAFTCEADTPELAQQLAQTTVDEFLAIHLAAHRNSRSTDFFAEQLAEAQVQLADAQRNLRATKNQHSVSSIVERRSHLEAKRGQLEKEQLEVESALAGARARGRAITDLIADIPAQLKAESLDAPNRAAVDMRSDLYDLEIRLEKASTSFTENHPLLRQLREQVASARQVLDSQPARRTETTQTVHPNRHPLELQLATEQSNVAAMEARQQRLDEQLSLCEVELRETNAHQVQIARQQQAVDQWKTHVDSYLEKMEQARLDQVLEQASISNISVIQPATLRRKPVRPKKLLTLAAAIVCGAIGAIGLALMSHYLTPGFVTVDEVENRLGLPVLTSMPLVEEPRLFTRNGNGRPHRPSSPLPGNSHD
ncbi:MAG: GNVR domain-containing protein [Pirellulaceae bacterium]|jgi:uncharacterized protein involved in exopolysaccharide biosynthesis|nr:GNVR domain-containing protein [Pirellulaceae bacterium]